MFSYVGKRVALAVPTLLVIATVTFLLVSLVPGDPANYILGRSATPQQIALLHIQLGLNRPLVAQYASWLGHAFQGNFGSSVITGQRVPSALATALPSTLSLAVLATVFSLVTGILVGTVIAVRGGRFDGIVQAISGFGVSIPSFWLAAILIYLFAIKLTIFPAGGYTTFKSSPWLWFVSLVLPASAIAINAACQVILQTRSSVLEVLSRDFVRNLQATGLPRSRVLYKHVLRNASIPVVQVAGLTFFFAISGVVVIEAIFNMPGLGSLLLSAVQSRDIPVVQGTILVFGVVVVVVNLLIDVLSAVLDPRIRLS